MSLLLIYGIVFAVIIGMAWYKGFASEEAKEFLRHFGPAIGIMGAIFCVGYMIYGLITG